MQHPISRPVAVALTALALAASPLTASAKIKCWKNSEGVRECGNTIPPEYAQQESEVKSKSGLTVEKKARAKTREEVEKERAEEERLAEQKAAEERAKKERAFKDRVLLSTYTTEDDILMTRDGRIAALESRINHTQQANDRLQGELDEMLTDAANAEKSGKKVPEELRASIAKIKRQIANNQAEIELRHRERSEITAQFEQDLERYRQLKGTATN